MNNNTTLLLGAVAYDPKVVTIWDGFQRYFARHGLVFDYILFSNYERQVESHVAGHIHVAGDVHWATDVQTTGRDDVDDAAPCDLDKGAGIVGDQVYFRRSPGKRHSEGGGLTG